MAALRQTLKDPQAELPRRGCLHLLEVVTAVMPPELLRREVKKLGKGQARGVDLDFDPCLAGHACLVCCTIHDLLRHIALLFVQGCCHWWLPAWITSGLVPSTL